MGAAVLPVDGGNLEWVVTLAGELCDSEGAGAGNSNGFRGGCGVESW